MCSLYYGLISILTLSCLLIHPAGLEGRPFPLILQLPNLFLQPLNLPRQPLNDF
jgi:hypothetical protein